MNNITNTIGFTILITILFLMIPNKSNFPKEIIIPILVAGITKYSLGDWDKKYKWTHLDILYWISIIVASIVTIYLSSLL
tara:strand:- start:561 stop:800 length:240 start_codon:yes stop_codon:yes gene_type:complete